MPDEITFFDLAALLKIKPDTTVERYGGMLNSSYFDGANIAGSLSQKKLISFNTAMPGQSVITITDTGKQLLNEANDRAQAEFDHLDLAILNQISAGKNSPNDVGTAVNVRSKDLAMHLFKLSQGDYISYDFRSGAVQLMLTEKGFAQSKAGMPARQAAAQPMQQQQPMQQKPMMATQEMPPAPQMQQAAMADAPAQQQDMPKAKGGKALVYVAIIVIIIILAAAAYVVTQHIA